MIKLFFIIKEYKNNNQICNIRIQVIVYIEEFVQHYRKMKVDNIFIYDNNEIDGEKFDDLLIL
jgi:hypothetical protein